ncbi:sensor domain-containing diguanylate cyclase [Solemya velum gill symbiont]|uniref:sensor domain-containing diguanylate cyclase n=1 Tax=Solemya velum gill symbiont TaxID=2340 RepID=UPI0015C30E5F|nr:sensor domain-containing diguanylate cyclase [Solemya velum gill symbiont]
MHRLLSRQLRKLDLTGSSLPDDVRWEALLQSISDTYQQADDDRYLLERSLQTSSDELQEMFQAQKATADGRLRALINTLPDLVFLLDEDGRYVDIISGDEHELVQPSMELKGKLLADVMSSEQASFFMDVIHRALETNTLQVVEYELAVQAGKRIFEGRVISTGLKVNDRKAVLFLARDVTELTKARNKLEHLATHDTLTGLPNRVLLENRLCQAVSRTKRTGKKAAVILMDLDRFKHVNDSLGHTVGDELLKEVSHRLKISCRAEDTVFRFGGDEFVIILEDLESAHHAGQAAKHFLDAFNDPLRLTEMELQISVSIGIAVVPDDGEEADILLRYADSTMYMAKEAGRNQYSFFTPELADNSANYLALEASLRKAISEHELVLRYQPQYSLEDAGNNLAEEKSSFWPYRN